MKNYVNFYNQKRIQSNLKWKTPEQVWRSLSF
ncbi:IS3 family transposase [Mesomycoplasma dispar]